MEKVHYQIEDDCFIQIAEPETITRKQVIALIHGGYWRQEKSLETVKEMQSFFVLHGYPVCNIEYRRGMNNPWPIPLFDVKSAIKQIKERYADFELILIGHSVGGQLALLNAAEAQQVIALAPVTDLVYTYEYQLGDNAVAEYFGEKVDEKELLAASPCQQLPLKTERCLIIHGSDDVRVDIETTLNYLKMNLLNRQNIELLVLPKMAHQDIIEPDQKHFDYILNWLN
ncbi:alpha/beta hydrolase [Enterococcus raffinosus]|uniref:alpha/beta hydrolase family protein n=1 Tax=Enterococcus raffinosus TaxID=71452 RepID=UPI001C112FA2|nr:alpha/beta hydrolase [Enterococcus raffinosus]MBU5360756.1 alpha/beta hydrolase [Enterococcus raffinosus]